MTWRTWTGMPGFATLAALLATGVAAGQEPEARRTDGGWRPPTPADALQIMREDPAALPVGARRQELATAVLQQRFERRPQAELDGLANALADLILDSEVPEDMTGQYYLERDIFVTLWAAARGGDHTPHPGSFDALVRIYETLVAEALAGGGTDPVEEIVRRSGWRGTSRLSRALRSILNADPHGRGADYLLAVVAESDLPKRDPWGRRPASLWCDAANILRQGGGLRPEENPRRAELPELALDDEMFYQRCGYH